MSVLIVTNMYPDSKAPYLGTFVASTRAFFGRDTTVPYPGNRSRNRKFLFYLQLYGLILPRILKAETVVIHYPLFFLPFSVAARLLRKTLILVYHGGEFMNRPNLRRWKDVLRQYIFKANNRLAHQILVPTQAVEDAYFQEWRDKVRVWYSGGVAVKRPTNRDTSRKRYYDLAYFGRDEPVKGYDCYIAALEGLSMCQLQRREYRCLEVIREACSPCRYTIGSLKVTRLPPLDHDQILSIMEECRYVVVPSRSESLCLIAVEAVVSGAAVIARRLPAIQEVLGPAALYFDTDEELVLVMERALQLECRQIQRLNARAQQQVKKLDRATLLKQFELQK